MGSRGPEPLPLPQQTLPIVPRRFACSIQTPMRPVPWTNQDWVLTELTLEHEVGVVFDEVDAECVLQGPVAVGHAVLGHEHRRVVVLVFDPVEDAAQRPRSHDQPRGPRAAARATLIQNLDPHIGHRTSKGRVFVWLWYICPAPSF